MEKAIRIFSPASVSNVGPGFDMMGFALEKPGDIMTVKLNNSKTLRIVNNSGIDLPEDPLKNVATVALQSMLNNLGTSQGFDLVFENKINPGSGVGSSAASCNASVFGANILLNSPFTTNELIPFALEGEVLASGSLHADNIAPSMLGGFVFIKSYNPLEIISLSPPDKLKCVVVHPSIQIKTSESRKILPELVSMKSAIRQCGNLAGLITGIIRADYDLIYRSLHDEFAEPYRSPLIPGYSELKEKLQQEAKGGCNISGSGPSIFFLSHSEDDIQKASVIMKNLYTKLNIKHEIYVSCLCKAGTRIV